MEKNEAPTEAKATTHHVKYAFSKPILVTQRQKPSKSNGILVLSKCFWKKVQISRNLSKITTNAWFLKRTKTATAGFSKIHFVEKGTLWCTPPAWTIPIRSHPPPRHRKGIFLLFWKGGCACKIWWGKRLGKFGARAPWPPPIKSMHITHGVWQVRIPRGIAQRDPSIKEEKAKHTNKRHFPRDLPKTMGAEHAERSPHHSKHNPTHTHQD